MAENKMVGGEAAGRILKEVYRGKLVSKDDTPAERDYRERIAKSVDTMHGKKQAAEMPKDWL